MRILLSEAYVSEAYAGIFAGVKKNRAIVYDYVNWMMVVGF
jgi:hypothetical protein